MRLMIGGKVGLFHYDWDDLNWLFSNCWGNGQIFPCRKVPISINCARTKNRRRTLVRLNRNKGSKGSKGSKWTMPQRNQQQNRVKRPGPALGNVQDENRWVGWSLIHGLHRICIVDTIMHRLRMNSLLRTRGLMREHLRKPTSGTFCPTEGDLMAKQMLPRFRLLVQDQDGEAAWGRHLPVISVLGALYLGLTPLSLRLVVNH